MAETICPQCKAVNKGTAQFCAECGTPLLSGLDKRSASQAQTLTKPIIETKIITERVLQNRYRIEESLGRGGFGSVYRAWDLNLVRACAIKENLVTSAEAQRQFMREATTLSNLSNPNMPRVIDHFIIPGQGQYLVMDYVAGEDLETILGRRELVTLEEASDWILQVTDALVYLHRQKPPIFHRDIKPANIRLTPDGRAMLVDFGLVKVSDPKQNTTQGARAITPGYAPPEQYGRGNTDGRSDLYALGATFYALLTGHEPEESVSRLTGKNLLPAHEANPNVPQAVSDVIDRSLALEPTGRFASAIEFREALSAALSQQPIGESITRISHPPAGTAIPTTVAVSGAVLQPAETIVVSQQLEPQKIEAVEAVTDAHGKASQPTKTKVKKGKIWLIAGFLLVIIAALGFGLVYLGSGDEEAPGPVEATLTAHALVNSQIRATLTARAGEQAAETPALEPKETIASPAIVPAIIEGSPTVEEAAPTEISPSEEPEATALPTAAGATEQARLDYLGELQEKATLAYGPKSGRLLHKAQSGDIQMISSSASARNFITKVTFTSPFSPSEGDWDFGLLFRFNDNFMEYRLIFFSDQSWGLASYIGNPTGKVLNEGTASALKIEAGEQNKIRLYVVEERGWIYLNDEFLTEFDASQHYSGGISIGVGFFEGQGITGKLTEYNDFTVWTLPSNP